jgi:crossover junction endodeoxyribonuclease RusA
MTGTIQLELPYPPSGNTAVRHAKGGHYVTAEVKAYRARVATIVGRRAPLVGPVHADFIFSPPDRRRRDADNAQKTLCDALTICGFWSDDSNKVIRSGSWAWTDPVPGGRVLITVSDV